jgi:hypothetical protein
VSLARDATGAAVAGGVFSVVLLAWTLLTVAGIIPAPHNQPVGAWLWLPVDVSALASGLFARWCWQTATYCRKLSKAVNRGESTVRSG